MEMALQALVDLTWYDEHHPHKMFNKILFLTRVYFYMAALYSYTPRRFLPIHPFLLRSR